MQFLSLLWEGKSLSPVTWANKGTIADTCSSSRTIRFLSWVKRRRNNFPWTAQHGGHYLCLSDTVSNTLTWLCLWTPPIASVSVKLLLQHKSSHASRLWIFLNIGKFSKKKKKRHKRISSWCTAESNQFCIIPNTAYLQSLENNDMTVNLASQRNCFHPTLLIYLGKT